MPKCAIIIVDRGSDVKKHCLIKNGAMPLFYDLRRELVGVATTAPAGFRFSLRKEFRDHKT